MNTNTIQNRFLYDDKTLSEHVTQLKGLGEMLVSYTFPRVDFKSEQSILLLKQNNLMVDGYDVLVCYSKADYDDYYLESVQVQATYAPFLSFALVCKIGRAFLGNSNLSYIEFFRNNRKVYCWTLKSRDGRLLPPDKKSKLGSFEGFDFSVMMPGSVDLF